jgi:sugar-specific transcriptional regulator TrmB
MTEPRIEEAIRTLGEIGFHSLEARVYVQLVENGPATAYRVAQDLGELVPRVYQIVDALYASGAVEFETGEPRRVRAVPPGELLDAAASRFEDRRTAAMRALDALRPSSTEEGVYDLGDRDQALQRARSMIAGARDVVLADLFPKVVDLLREDLANAAARGVAVAVLTYAETRIDGVHIAGKEWQQQIRARWPGQWLNVVVDGAEALLAYLDDSASALRQGVWTRSPHVAWVCHSGLVSEIALADLTLALDEKATATTLRHRLNALAPYKALDTAGARAVSRMLGEGGT